MGGSKQRGGRARAEPEPAWWTIGGPCAVVAAMLFLGGVLRSPTDGAQTLNAEPDRTRQPIDLVATANEDAERLSLHPGAWTLQFMVACERQSLDPIVEVLDDQPNFFLLHSPDAGKDCYRVCWGWFPSEAEAERPRGYPEVLSDIAAMGWARPIGEVLP
jgi:hypothetical protein